LTIIGEKLKAAREEKGYSIEHVSRETNIASRYITALEEGRFSQFPAEAYLIGFLKNYGEYLALDVKELQDQYKMHKIQEQPIPVEQLLKEQPGGQRIVIEVIITILAAVLIAALVFYFVKKPQKPDSFTTPERPSVYELTEGVLEQRFYGKDTIRINGGGSEWTLSVQKIADSVILGAPDGVLTLNLNDVVTSDINGDGAGDLIISAQDFLPGSPESGVLLRLELLSTSSPAEEHPATPGNLDIPQGNQASNLQAIFTGPSPFPFTVQIKFQGYCMLRWEVLREANQGRNERYFVKGEDLDVQAQNGVRLWISNASVIKTQVIGGGRTVPVDFGGPGEVVVADINWMKDADGRYKLIQTRLEN
jgi:cytoskeletal protein RodZ